MKKLDRMLMKLQMKAENALSEIKNSERGDTNFVSMLLIIGIVVVLAGLYLVLVKDTVFPAIEQKVGDFLNSLG